MRGRREPRDVRPGARVAGLDREHRAGTGVRGQGLSYGVDRQSAGQPGDRVDRRRHPDRAQPGQHEPEQQRTVHGARDDDLVAGLPDRQRQRLVAVRRAAHREPGPVRLPQLRGEGLCLGEHTGRRSHRREVPPQRQVAGDHRPDQVGRALVPRDHERSLPRTRRREGVVEVRDRGPVLVAHAPEATGTVRGRAERVKAPQSTHARGRWCSHGAGEAPAGHGRPRAARRARTRRPRPGRRHAHGAPGPGRPHLHRPRHHRDDAPRRASPRRQRARVAVHPDPARRRRAGRAAVRVRFGEAAQQRSGAGAVHSPGRHARPPTC